MNKSKIVLASVGGVVLVASLALAYMTWSAYSEKAERVEEFDDAVSTAAGCMSPASMLLAGFVLGGFPPKELLKGGRSYIMSAIRLLGIPALVAGVLWLVGMRGMYLALPVMILSMPLGLNLVVYPESLGIDASPNARMCFVCNLLTVLILPFTFSLLSLVM